MKDILQDKSMQKMPYNVPEGYFNELKAGLKMIPLQSARRRWEWKRTVAIAASIALLAAAGGFFIERFVEHEEFSAEDYMVFSDDFISSAYCHELSSQYADAHKMTQNDIVEYLIYADVDIEEIAQVHNP